MGESNENRKGVYKLCWKNISTPLSIWGCSWNECFLKTHLAVRIPAPIFWFYYRWGLHFMLLQPHQEAQSIKNKKKGSYLFFSVRGKTKGWIYCCLIQRTDLELHSMHNYKQNILLWNKSVGSTSFRVRLHLVRPFLCGVLCGVRVPPMFRGFSSGTFHSPMTCSYRGQVNWRFQIAHRSECEW